MFFLGRRAGTEQGLSRRSEAGRREMPHREGERKQEKAFSDMMHSKDFFDWTFKIENSGAQNRPWNGGHIPGKPVLY